jgi:hypothetical protein
MDGNMFVRKAFDRHMPPRGNTVYLYCVQLILTTDDQRNTAGAYIYFERKSDPMMITLARIDANSGTKRTLTIARERPPCRARACFYLYAASARPSVS